MVRFRNRNIKSGSSYFGDVPLNQTLGDDIDPHETECLLIDGVVGEIGTTGEPTGDWPVGATVETDDGVYKQLRSGTWHEL